LPTMDGDGVIEFVLNISSFVFGSLHFVDCCGTMMNSVIIRL
jgi:hypothetical protein